MIPSNVIYSKWEEYFKIKTNRDYVSLYIHIPYCLSKCNFCMHSSKKIENNDQIDNYLSNLEKQFIKFSQIFNNQEIKTIYIGGGTPSLLNIKQLKRLFSFFEYFNIDKNIDNQFSIELHPLTTTIEKIDYLHTTIINRISMGVQSLDKQVLKNENRNNPDNTLDIIKYLMFKFKDKKSRINIDLMYGLNGQTDKSALDDFYKIANTSVSKITLYGYEKYRNKKEHKIFYNNLMNYIKKIKHNKFNTHITDDQGTVNYFINKNFNGWFKYMYTTQPLIYNNCLSLGAYSNSWIIPNKFIYTNMLNRFSENIHYKNYNELTHGYEKQIDDLRIEQIDKKWEELYFNKIIF